MITDAHMRGLMDDANFILAKACGLDVTSPHGASTARRFVTALDEITGCRDCDGTCIKWKTFPSTSDQMVVIKDIPFVSVCNHHVLPFIGKAHIGYIPKTTVAGLSKFARVVKHYARQLQVQEELTENIATFLEKALGPDGIAVVLQAEHTCMTMRGVQAPGTYTTTAIMRGAFADHSRTAKQEFMTYLNGSL